MDDADEVTDEALDAVTAWCSSDPETATSLLEGEPTSWVRALQRAWLRTAPREVDWYAPLVWLLLDRPGGEEAIRSALGDDEVLTSLVARQRGNTWCAEAIGVERCGRAHARQIIDTFDQDAVNADERRRRALLESERLCWYRDVGHFGDLRPDVWVRWILAAVDEARDHDHALFMIGEFSLSELVDDHPDTKPDFVRAARTNPNIARVLQILEQDAVMSGSRPEDLWWHDSSAHADDSRRFAAVTNDPRVTVIGLDHIVLTCTDVNVTLAWYLDELGLAPVRVDDWRAGRAPFPSVRVNEHTIIDLIEGTPTDDRLDHVCLVVEPTDLAAIVASRRFDVLEGPVPRYGAQGNGTSIYIRDPDGTTVELRHYGTQQLDV